MTVDYIDIARDLLEAHVNRMNAGGAPSVTAILIDADRCPQCAGPLLTLIAREVSFGAGSSRAVSVCRGCGHEVHR